jgi:hypothetical protein
MELKYIIDSYISRFRDGERRELEWHRNQPTLNAAIKMAALATDQLGKRHKHQCRFQRATLEGARDSLLQIMRAIKRANSFDELHSLIEAELLPRRGINELYIYDTALRIGAYLGHLPRKVYLHRGTRQGARALGFHETRAISLSQFPSEFNKLSAHEIEDLLCIYRDYFQRPRSEGYAAALGCHTSHALSSPKLRVQRSCS